MIHSSTLLYTIASCFIFIRLFYITLFFILNYWRTVFMYLGLHSVFFYDIFNIYFLF